MQKIPLGIVHGRFQPPHNGHVRFIQEALNRADHVIIGICTPTICTEEEAELTGYPCAPHMNPFSHNERIDMITLALAEISVPKNHYSFIPFPSDYQNIDSIVSKDTVFFMSVTSEHDQKKIDHLRNKDYKVETILSLPDDTNRESSSIIRKQLEGWEKIAPQSVVEYIKNIQSK